MYATGKQRSFHKVDDINGSPVNEKSMLLDQEKEIDEIKKQLSKRGEENHASTKANLKSKKAEDL